MLQTEWHQLKYVMTKKYVSQDYKNQMRLDIAMAKQGNKTPLEFFSQLEDMYYKASISVVPSIMRTKFLSGLNLNIRDQLEVLPIKNLNDLTHAAIKSTINSFGSAKSLSNNMGNKGMILTLINYLQLMCAFIL